MFVPWTLIQSSFLQGCWKLFRAEGANRAKGASRAEGANRAKGASWALEANRGQCGRITGNVGKSQAAGANCAKQAF